MSETQTGMEQTNGYVYLVIPPELKGTNRVKIGMSKLNNDSRIKSYGKGTDVVIKFNCFNINILENKIINAFKNNFELIKGNEYFKGDIEEMKNIFLQELTKHQIDNESSIEEHKQEIDNESNIEIQNTFSTYKEEKYLLKVKIYDYGCIELISIKNNNCEDIFTIDTRYDVYLKEYIEKLIENKVIENNKIYNIYDKSFVKKLNKYKNKIKIILSSKNIKKINEKWYKNDTNIIDLLFSNNTIINNKYYSCKIKSETYNKRYLYLGDCSLYLHINFIKINNIVYDEDYLREYIPYLIEVNDNNEYYIINRDYEYIGLNTKCINRTDNISWKRVYIFNDGNKPWVNNKNLLEYNMKLKDLIKDKVCLNINENTLKIIDN
jgi:hypothetical protein